MKLKVGQIYKFVIKLKSNSLYSISYYHLVQITRHNYTIYQFKLMSHDNTYKYWGTYLNIFAEHLHLFNIQKLNDEDKLELL